MRINALTLSFLALLMLAACGRSTETVVVRSDPAAMATPAQERAEEDRPTLRPAATDFRYGEWQRIPSLDPLFANNTASQRAVQLIYEGLLRFDADGNITGAHATRWQADRDSLAWTFTLNRDRFFHDDEAFITGRGRRVTAADFKRSFERMASPDVPPYAAELFREIIFGFDSFYREQRNLTPGKTPNYTQVEGIIAQNDSTLRIELNRADPHFLHRLASPYAVVYPQEAIRRYTAMHRNPVGSGPYTLRSVTGDSLFVLNRFAGHTTPTGNGINRIEIHSIPNETRLYRNLATGNLSMIPEPGPLLLQGLLNEDGSLRASFEERYRLTALGQKTWEVAWNPANRFGISRDEAASVLQHAFTGALSDSLNIPLLRIENRVPDAGTDGFNTVSRRFPESVSRRNMLLMNFPDPAAGHILNAVAVKLRNDINIRTIQTDDAGIAVLFITRRQAIDAGGTTGAAGPETLATFTLPRFAVSLRTAPEIRFNRHEWWMGIP
jgi:ABC-type transport system substrate-binding protein